MRLHIIDIKSLCLSMNEPSNTATNEPKPGEWSNDPLQCPNNILEDPPYLPLAARPLGQSKRLSDKTICMSALQGPDRQFNHYDVHNLYGLSQAEPTLE